MKVYDCDNEEQFEKLTNLTNKVDYIKLNLIQSFSPDNIDEAKNRGFKPTYLSANNLYLNLIHV